MIGGIYECSSRKSIFDCVINFSRVRHAFTFLFSAEQNDGTILGGDTRPNANSSEIVGANIFIQAEGWVKWVGDTK